MNSINKSKLVYWQTYYNDTLFWQGGGVISMVCMFLLWISKSVISSIGGVSRCCQYNWDSSLHCHSFNPTNVLCHNFISLLLLIQGYVACLNLTLTEPMQCTQFPCQSLTFSWLTFKCTLQAVFCRIFLIHFGKEKATLTWALTKIFSCQVDLKYNK